MRKMTLIGVLLLASAMECVALPPEDEATMRRIVRFLVPQCGGNRTTRVEYIPELIDVLNINGDTNRLARLLAELAQTNSAWYAKMAMWQLEKYGTPAQLPFLYSCATNPAVANSAMKAMLRIEGVTSNSVEMVRRYLEITNVSESVHWDHVEVFKMMFDMLGDNAPPSDKELVLGCIMRHAPENRRCPRQLDEVILSADTGYRFSKRRLSVLRGVYLRGLNEFQLPYVTNAISELVAYPEANLPD